MGGGCGRPLHGTKRSTLQAPECVRGQLPGWLATQRMGRHSADRGRERQEQRPPEPPRLARSTCGNEPTHLHLQAVLLHTVGGAEKAAGGDCSGHGPDASRLLFSTARRPGSVVESQCPACVRMQHENPATTAHCLARLPHVRVSQALQLHAEGDWSPNAYWQKRPRTNAPAWRQMAQLRSKRETALLAALVARG